MFLIYVRFVFIHVYLCLYVFLYSSFIFFIHVCLLDKGESSSVFLPNKVSIQDKIKEIDCGDNFCVALTGKMKKQTNMNKNTYMNE